MQYLQVVSIFLLLVIGVYSAEKECTKPGYMCANCTQLALCIEENGGFQKHYVRKCDSTTKCITDNCVTAPDPICDDMVTSPFRCQAVGIFPHPFICNKYVICVMKGATLQPYENTCSDGYAYNAKTTYCDKPLANKVCGEREYPLPVCTELGSIAAVTENPTIYYICEPYSVNKQVLYPFQYLCLNGEIYNGYECSKEDPISSSTEPTTIETTTNNPSTPPSSSNSS